MDEMQFAESRGFMSQMFAQPILWLLALIPVMLMTVVTFVIPPTARMGMLGLNLADMPDQTLGTKMLLHSFLWVFGVGITDNSLGVNLTVVVGSSLLMGLLALLLGLVAVGLVTRRSNDGFYAVGPLMVYSLLASLMLAAGSHQEGAHLALPWLLFRVALWLLGAGLAAKFVLVLLYYQGLLEIDRDAVQMSPLRDDLQLTGFLPQRVQTGSGGDVSVRPQGNGESEWQPAGMQERLAQDAAQRARSAVATADQPARLTPMAQMVNKLGRQLQLFTGPSQAMPVAPVEDDPRGKRVTRAVVCPFCGSHRVRHTKQEVRCLQRGCGVVLSAFREKPESPRCQHCENILVKGATYCHHCGAWQNRRVEDGAIGGIGT